LKLFARDLLAGELFRPFHFFPPGISAGGISTPKQKGQPTPFSIPEPGRIPRRMRRFVSLFVLILILNPNLNFSSSSGD